MRSSHPPLIGFFIAVLIDWYLEGSEDVLSLISESIHKEDTACDWTLHPSTALQVAALTRVRDLLCALSRLVQQCGELTRQSEMLVALPVSPSPVSSA
ncbi:hypothetical protein BDN67DRAFT_439800 [Paxillus ammoniavirescens]|nr:hypothetical protein BDN67DRAFT_439800 [Paxillus ammoniavirescens]